MKDYKFNIKKFITLWIIFDMWLSVQEKPTRTNSGNMYSL